MKQFVFILALFFCSQLAVATDRIPVFTEGQNVTYKDKTYKVKKSYWDSYNNIFRYVLFQLSTQESLFNIEESDLELKQQTPEEIADRKEVQEFMRAVQESHKKAKEQKDGHCKTIERAWF